MGGKNDPLVDGDNSRARPPDLTRVKETPISYDSIMHIFILLYKVNIINSINKIYYIINR
jgi:hypothetical protein